MVPDVAVPTYQAAYDSLGGAYQPSADLINQQLAQVPTDEQTTLSSLDQAKANAFRDIGNAANAKGMLFSGFTPDQQAQYIGTKYLPAVAAAKTAALNQKTTLEGKLNDLSVARSTAANDIVSKATAAAQAAAYKNAQLAISQQKAATAAANTTNKLPSQQQVSAAIRSGLSSVRGGDGYVSPQDYAQAYADWVQAGFNGQDFDKYFGDLMNPKNGYYQYAKTQVR